MTQPLLAGVVTALAPSRPGQAVGLNVFTLFFGFGIGSLVFGRALVFGFPLALALFAIFQLAPALVAHAVFRQEARVTSNPLPE